MTWGSSRGSARTFTIPRSPATPRGGESQSGGEIEARETVPSSVET